MDTSKLFNINLADVLKGVIVTALGVVLSALLDIIQAGAMPTLDQWQAIGITGLTAGIAYIIKNFFSNNTGQVLKADKPVGTTETTVTTSTTTTGGG